VTVTSRLTDRETKKDKERQRKTERRWVLLKIPRGDIDGVGEGK
jgi:hypothetical protein